MNRVIQIMQKRLADRPDELGKFLLDSWSFMLKQEKILGQLAKIKRSGPSAPGYATAIEVYNADGKALFHEFLKAMNIPKELYGTSVQIEMEQEKESVNAAAQLELLDPTCPMCKHVMRFEEKSVTLSCPNCAYSKYSPGHMPVMGYDEFEHATQERKETYKRVVRFQDVLRQAQGRSNATMDQSKRDMLHAEIKKRRLQPHLITPKMVRRMMKKLKLSKFYSHVHSFTSVVNPAYVPPYLTPMQENQMRQLFLRIEMAFGVIKQSIENGTIQSSFPLPKSRSSFMSHPYVAHKICELLGWDELMEAFALLKSELLVVEQDKWWRLVCRHLKWQFISTIGNVMRTNNVSQSSTQTPWKIPLSTLTASRKRRLGQPATGGSPGGGLTMEPGTESEQPEEPEEPDELEELDPPEEADEGPDDEPEEAEHEPVDVGTSDARHAPRVAEVKHIVPPRLWGSGSELIFSR